MADLDRGIRSEGFGQMPNGPGTPRFELPEIDWRVMFPRLKYYCWLIFTKLILGVVYLSIIRDGFRFVLPALSMKLSRIPGFGFLDDFEFTYQLDLAAPMALFVLLAVFWLWDRALSMWLHGDDGPFDIQDPLFRVRREIVFYSLAVVVLTMDGILFYVSLVRSNWGATMISPPAVVATVLYTAVLVCVTLMTLELRQQMHNAMAEKLLDDERNSL